MEDDEQVVVVDVDLRALVARDHVLEVEGVEVEVLLEPGLFENPGPGDLHPAEALRGDLRDPWSLRLSGSRGDELAGAGPAQSGAREVRHLQDLSCSSLPIPSVRPLYGTGEVLSHACTRFPRMTRCYIPPSHNHHIKRGGGTGPMKPRQPPRTRSGEGANSSRCRFFLTKCLEDVGRAF